jgi:hypothetical protein
VITDYGCLENWFRHRVQPEITTVFGDLFGGRCAEGSEVVSVCQANLIGSSTSSCNVPDYKSTSNVVVKARRTNLCIYSLNALNFRPSKKDITLCDNEFYVCDVRL